MTYTHEEAERMLFEAIKQLGSEWVEQHLPAAVKGWRPYTYLYQPNALLKAKIAELPSPKEQPTTQRSQLELQRAGQLMEEITFLAFRCLKGWTSIKSYQSYAPQIDLVIMGDDPDWRALIDLLHLNWSRRTIVIEAKNLAEKVNDNQFSRLCSILNMSFSQQADLGVFLSHKGATGFPEPGAPLRSLRDAQATQIIFHAKTGKYVVVFDGEDVRRLAEDGALPKLLEQKIRAVEEWTGRPVPSGDDAGIAAVEVVLPPHLAQYCE